MLVLGKHSKKRLKKLAEAKRMIRCNSDHAIPQNFDLEKSENDGDRGLKIGRFGSLTSLTRNDSNLSLDSCGSMAETSSLYSVGSHNGVSDLPRAKGSKIPTKCNFFRVNSYSSLNHMFNLHAKNWLNLGNFEKIFHRNSLENNSCRC